MKEGVLDELKRMIEDSEVRGPCAGQHAATLSWLLHRPAGLECDAHSPRQSVMRLCSSHNTISRCSIHHGVAGVHFTFRKDSLAG